MARTRLQNHQRGVACRDYRLSTNGECEVSRWLVDDREAARWMSGVCLGSKQEVHHIAGRGKSSDFELPCNLILLDNAAHAWVEHKPNEGQLISLYAKWRKFLDLGTLGKLPFDKSLHDWNVDVMSRLVRPCDGLAGRISYVMDKVDCKGVYWQYGLEMLHSIEGADIEF